MPLGCDGGALQTYPGASGGALRNLYTPTQTISPTGLASSFTAGHPTLKYNQNLSPGGLASWFAAGAPSIEFIGYIMPTGKPSDFAVGVPLLSHGTITPTGKPSDFAAGNPTLNLVQAVSTTGKASDFAAGKPSLIPAQIISPSGLASSFAAGRPTVVGGPQAILPRGLPSGFQAGFPTLSGPSSGLQIFLGGVDMTKYISLEGVANQGLDATDVMQPLQITSQTIGRWTAVFDFIDLEMDAYPEVDQTFMVMENGVKYMSGGVIAVQISRMQSSIGPLQCYHVTCQDWSAICDRREVNATYPEGSDIAGIVLSIWQNVLCSPNEGITANNVPPIGGPLGSIDKTEVFNFVSVTQAFNQLATDTGCIWWIDVNADLHFVDYTSLPSCPYTLTESLLTEFRALTATATLVDYRNTQYVVSNLTAIPGVANQSGPGGGPGTPGYGGPVITETYIIPQAAAEARGFFLGCIITNFTIAQITALTVNGVSQPFYSGLDGYNFQQAWWYFPGFNILTAPNAGNDAPFLPSPPVTSPYPNIGDTVVVSYIAIAGAQTAVVQTGPNGPLQPVTPGAAGSWGSGVFENVFQVQNLNLQSDLNALAGALLNRSDFVPVQVQFETDMPGAAVGQNIYIDIPISFIPGSTQWTITSVQGTVQSGKLRYGSYFRWVVQATSGQDLGNSTFWFERLLQRTENPLPIQQNGTLTFTLAPGYGLVAGDQANNPTPLMTAGTLTVAYVMCGVPPTGQSMEIDILDNGTSILLSPIVVTDGDTTQEFSTGFAAPGLTVAMGDLLTVSVTYKVTSTSPTPASYVTVFVQWSVSGLPAGQVQPGVYQQYIG